MFSNLKITAHGVAGSTLSSIRKRIIKTCGSYSTPHDGLFLDNLDSALSALKEAAQHYHLKLDLLPAGNRYTVTGKTLQLRAELHGRVRHVRTLSGSMEFSTSLGECCPAVDSRHELAFILQGMSNLHHEGVVLRVSGRMKARLRKASTCRQFASGPGRIHLPFLR